MTRWTFGAGERCLGYEGVRGGGSIGSFFIVVADAADAATDDDDADKAADDDDVDARLRSHFPAAGRCTAQRPHPPLRPFQCPLLRPSGSQHRLPLTSSTARDWRGPSSCGATAAVAADAAAEVAEAMLEKESPRKSPPLLRMELMDRSTSAMASSNDAPTPMGK